MPHGMSCLTITADQDACLPSPPSAHDKGHYHAGKQLPLTEDHGSSGCPDVHSVRAHLIRALFAESDDEKSAVSVGSHFRMRL